MTKITVCKGCGIKMEAVDEQGKPACVICFGGSSDNSIPVEIEAPPVMYCHYCNKSAEPSSNLAFAEPAKGKYYCGCRGWD